MISSRGWTIAYVVGPVLLVVAVIALEDAVAPAAASLALIAAWFATWLLVGRRADEGNRPAVAFTAIVVVIMGAMSALEPSLATAQFLAVPTVWSIARSFRAAIVANVLVVLAVAAGLLISLGTDPAALTQIAATQGITGGFGIIMGTWITRIATLSDERRELVEKLTAAQDELALLHRDAGVTDERARLAREIHDTIAQSLTGLVMLGQRARRELAGMGVQEETLELIETGARDALVETRSLVAASAPVELGGGLVDALERLVGRFARETGIDLGGGVAVLTEMRGLSRDDEVALLRCAQEGLANVRKHSGATRASVVVGVDAGATVLRVTDDGRGFDPERVEAGFGLRGLRERLALVGGELRVGGADAGGGSGITGTSGIAGTPGTTLEARLPRREVLA